ncbi:hypothetical protein [Aliikangiella maris]|uniref:Uncharacterized protein n=2 Tax=Aliikangiella maris TaxID=3162458 RepID=A0ABV3MTW3_9GAMM
MTKAIKITINGVAFLLPESHSNYEFPTYIIENKEKIIEYINQSKKIVNDWQNAKINSLPDLSIFKEKTGIIGFPLNAHDVELYILDRDIDVVFEMDF